MPTAGEASLAPSRPTLDTELALASALGRGAGLTREALHAFLPRVAAVHAKMEEAATSGQLPHLRSAREPHLADPAIACLSAWGAGGIVLIGEPAAASAATLIAGAGAPVCVVDGPDPSLVAGARGRHLVVLDGPAWVRPLARVLATRCDGAAVFGGDGTEPDGWALPGTPRFDLPGACDPRFGAVGGAALAIAAACGVELGPVQEALADMASRCAARGLYDNPAYLLAAAASHLGEGDGQPIVLVPSRRLLPLGALFVRAWTAATVGALDQGNLRVPHGTAPLAMVAGDEALVQRVGGGGAWMLAAWTDDPGPDPDGLWEWARALCGAHVRQAVQAGCPVLRLRLPALGPPALAASALLFAHAALTASALRGRDPLALPAADALRDLQRREIADNGG